MSFAMHTNGTVDLKGVGQITRTGVVHMDIAHRQQGQPSVQLRSDNDTPLNIREQLVVLQPIGRGASGVVRLALHVPSLTVRLC
jgi:hypothetical protein